MKILAIETSSKLCSVAILENTKLISKIEKNEGLTHSEILMPLIEKIFKDTNITLSDIDLLTCDIGPGSFTGIRIGIATIKAFSDSMKIPAIGINSLECYANNTNSTGIVCSIIDCKNNNCYFAIYEITNNGYNVLVNPQSNSIDNCIDLIKKQFSDKVITFTGDGSIAYENIIKNNIKTSKFADKSLNTLDTYRLGCLAYNKFQNLYSSNINNIPELLPLYLKKPQAQQQLENKSAKIELMKSDDLKNINISDFDDFWNLSNLEDDLSSEKSKWYIMKIENEIIGFVGIKVIIDEADIMNIAIAKKFRHQGFGKKLLSYIIDSCKQENIKQINLEVNENNIPAINLYKSFNFIEVGRRKKYYENDDAILLNLNLTK